MGKGINKGRSKNRGLRKDIQKNLGFDTFSNRIKFKLKNKNK